MSRVRWSVIALETPRVHRRCPRCDEERPFASSDRFRVNANQRRLDVWLIYRCPACDFTWNLTVVERATPESIGRARLDAYHANDREAAWDCAFDARLLARAGARAGAAVPYRIEGESAPEVELAIPRPVGVRLDRLLADGLGVPRARLADWFDQGALRVSPAGHSPLRRPAIDGQVIGIDAVRDRS